MFLGTLGKGKLPNDTFKRKVVRPNKPGEIFSMRDFSSDRTTALSEEDTCRHLGFEKVCNNLTSRDMDYC